MNTSPRRAQEEPQKSHQQVLFEKLSELRSNLRSALITITRTGVKKSIEDLEMDLLFTEFAQEFGFGKAALLANEKNDEARAGAIKKKIQELSREVITVLRDYGKNQSWSKVHESKAKLLFYRVKEFVDGLEL
jgi:hypothetical protein